MKAHLGDRKKNNPLKQNKKVIKYYNWKNDCEGGYDFQFYNNALLDELDKKKNA